MCESDRAPGKRVREMVEDMGPSLLGIIQVIAKDGQDPASRLDPGGSTGVHYGLYCTENGLPRCFLQGGLEDRAK